MLNKCVKTMTKGLLLIFILVLFFSLTKVGLGVDQYIKNKFSHSTGFDQGEIDTAQASVTPGGGTVGYTGQYGYGIDGDGIVMDGTPQATLTMLSSSFYGRAWNNISESYNSNTQIGARGSKNGAVIRMVTIVHLQGFMAFAKEINWSMDVAKIGGGTSDQIKLKIESSASTFANHNMDSTDNSHIKLAENTAGSNWNISTGPQAISGQYLRLTIELWSGSKAINTITSNYKLAFKVGPNDLSFKSGGRQAWPTVSTAGDTMLNVGAGTRSNHSDARWSSASTAAGDNDLRYNSNLNFGDGISRTSGNTRTDELIMDQGRDGQHRRLIHWLTIPLSADITARIAEGKVSMTFSSKISNNSRADAVSGIFIAWGSGSQTLTDFNASYAKTSDTLVATTNWVDRSVTIGGIAKSGVTHVRVAIYQVRGGNSSAESELFAKDMKINITSNVSVGATSYLDGGVNTGTGHGLLQIDNGATGGSLTAQKPVGSSVALKATPNDGYYLSYWRKNSGVNVGNTTNNPTINTTIANADAFVATIWWDAYFATINTENRLDRIYNGQPQTLSQQPSLQSGYTAEYTYTGTPASGGNYNSSVAPTQPGTYTIRLSVRGGGTEMGYKTIPLNIRKYDIASINTTDILYGQKLNESTLTGVIIHPYTGNPVTGIYQWHGGDNIPSISGADNAYEKEYDFIPNDSSLPIIERATADVNIRLGTQIEAIRFGANGGQNLFSYDFANTKIVNGKATIGLSATPYDTGNYVFVGWQKGGNYISTDLNTVYTLTSEEQGETRATFRAVFAQYTLNNQATKTINNYYTGGLNRVDLYLDLYEYGSAYGVGYTPLVYSSGTAPIAVGSYTISFNIRNTKLDKIVASPTINLNVLENDVNVTVDTNSSLGYNALNGWAHAITFNISASGVQAGGIQKYMYTTDDGLTWHDVPGTPSNALDCPIIFEASSVNGDEQSVTIPYKFKGVHATYGQGEQKSVATSNQTVYCKIDTITPTLDIQLQNNYAGDWTNQDVVFTFDASAGGSGALILYSTDDGINWHDTSVVAFNMGEGTGVIILNLDWIQSTEQLLTYKFRMISGTGIETEIPYSYLVKIDKTAPTITYQGINQEFNDNGWINQDATGIFTVSERANTSGIKSIVSNNGGQLLLNSGEINAFDNNCFLTIPDYKIYTITVTDYAGNISTLDIHEKVDTMTPILSLSQDSYQNDTWINDVAKLNFIIDSGASGIRILFSTDNGASYQYFDTSELFLFGEDSTEAFQTIFASYEIDDEQSLYYMFKVENGSGLSYVVDFGNINIDKTAPIIIDNDKDWMLDLIPYQQNSWVDDFITFLFRAEDGHDLFNSGIASVVVDNDGTMISYGDTKYSFEIQKCTVYTVTVTDIAGNVTQKSYSAKVDVGEPVFGYSAYIGETSEEYTFDEHLWLSGTLYGDDAYVRFVFDMYFTPSGARMQYSIDNGANWIDLTGNLLEEGNEGALEQYVQITVNVKSQQNNPYMVRMISGSGRVMEGELLGYIRIDFTPPEFSSMTFWGVDSQQAIAEEKFTSTWGYDSIQARFSPTDAPSGIKNVEVRKFAYDADVTSSNYTIVPHNINAGVYSFDMDDYAQYVLVLMDNADNIYTHHTLTPKIDKTDGFDFTIDAGDYISDTWLFNEEDNVRFSLDILFNNPEYTAFGMSGGWAEFSVGNGWTTYIMIGEHRQEIKDNDTLQPYLDINISQVRSYQFRVVTGAGRVVTSTQTFIVKKDIVLPYIDLDVSVAGESYNAEWVNANVDFGLNMVVGASQATYYFATSKDATISNENAVSWTALGNLTEGNMNRTFTVMQTTDHVYYYFRLVAGTGRSYYTSSGSIVNIDKDPIYAMVTAYENGVEYNGGWTHKDINIVLSNISQGPSGITVTYQSRRIGQAVFGSPTTDGFDAENNILTLTSNTEHEYRLLLVGGSGREFYASILPVKIDKQQPTFTLLKSGTELTDTQNNNGWWISDLRLTYNVLAGESGYIPQYAVSQDGTNWSEWTAEGIDANILILSDDSTKGGTIKYYRFRVVSGANLSSLVNDYGAIKIDTNHYSITGEQFVSSTAGNYASITNTGSTFMRGQSISSTINTYAGYYIKSLSVMADNEIIKDEYMPDKSTTYSDYSVEISGQDILVTLSCYKEIYITYNNRLQYLQGRTITDAYITVDETGFMSIYGDLEFVITYNGDSQVPQQIGVYQMQASIHDDSFIIMDLDSQLREMIIVYFGGDGTKEYPYLINDNTDLTYIDKYMADDYDYLGENRKEAVFMQTTDIELHHSFIAIGSQAIFTGCYNGNNFSVSYDATFTPTDNFGFFQEIGSGATVSNLGVEFDNINVINNGIIVGLVVAVAQEGSTIDGCYAIGDIYASADDVTLGGLVGHADNTELKNLFSDVHIYILNASGKMGGLVGLLDNSLQAPSFYNNYTISWITAVDCSSVDIGAMVGYINGNMVYDTNALNSYLSNNISINAVPYSQLAFGNQGEWENTGILPHVFEVFLGSEWVIGDNGAVGWQNREVGNLSRRRINMLGLVGLGTDNQPFIIDSADKFIMLEVFPFAHFKQAGDIVIGETETLNEHMVFTGVFDGNLYAIINPILTNGYQYGGFIGLLKGTIKNVRIVDLQYDFDNDYSRSYIGGVAGLALGGSLLSNIIVSGAINMQNAHTSGNIYIGGVVGVLQSSHIDNTISLVNINVAKAYAVVAGGITAQSEGSGTINSIVSLSRVSVNFNGYGYIGSSIGLVYDNNVSGNNIYNVSGNTYVNGRSYDISIGQNHSTTVRGISARTYDQTVSSASGITISGTSVISLIKGLYPFSGGTGRYDDPFVIMNYRELLRIGDFMYASFVLGNDIIIGDYDGDGIRDEDYNYDFDTIGKGAVFTGTLDGKNPYSTASSYSISGLTDSLFEINAGQIKNITLNINYRVYPDGDPNLDIIRTAKAVEKDQSVVFGAVAKYNRKGGDLKMVIVNGDIHIKTKGIASIKAGSLVGVAQGGSVIGSISYVNFYVDGLSVDVGGVVGVIEGDTRVEGSILTTLDFNIILENINAKGGNVNAGLIVGASLSPNAQIKEDIGTNARVYINGKRYDNLMVGMRAY